MNTEESSKCGGDITNPEQSTCDPNCSETAKIEKINRRDVHKRLRMEAGAKGSLVSVFKAADVESEKLTKSAKSDSNVLSTSKHSTVRISNRLSSKTRGNRRKYGADSSVDYGSQDNYNQDEQNSPAPYLGKRGSGVVSRRTKQDGNHASNNCNTSASTPPKKRKKAVIKKGISTENSGDERNDSAYETHGSMELTSYPRESSEEENSDSNENGDSSKTKVELDSDSNEELPVCENKKRRNTSKGLKIRLKRRNNASEGQPRNKNEKTKTNKQVQCEKCSKILSSHSSYKQHMVIHGDEKPHLCPECGRGFTQAGNLRTHINSIHMRIQLFRCHLCSKAFSQKSALDSHVKTHLEEEMLQKYLENVKNLNHPQEQDELSFTCLLCSEVFDKIHIWVFHMRSHLENDLQEYTSEQLDEVNEVLDKYKDNIEKYKTYECGVCRKIFYTQYARKCHEVIHTRVKSYQCRHCDRAFERTSQRRLHEQYHTQEFHHICQSCGEGFPRRRDLQIHQVKFHNTEAESLDVHSCPNCPKIFRYKNALMTHISVVHDQKRSFVCEVCWKTFGTQYSLEIHKRTHTSERPYTCVVCEKTFADPSNLIHHGQRTHPSLPKSAFRRRKNLSETADTNEDLETQIQQAKAEWLLFHEDKHTTPQSGPSLVRGQRTDLFQKDSEMTTLPDTSESCQNFSPDSKQETVQEGYDTAVTQKAVVTNEKTMNSANERCTDEQSNIPTLQIRSDDVSDLSRASETVQVLETIQQVTELMQIGANTEVEMDGDSSSDRDHTYVLYV